MIIPVVIGALFLGQAFDRKSASTTPFYIFDPDDIASNKMVIPRTYTQSQYKFLDSSSEANDFLNIDGEISLKVKNDKFKFQGIGNYLTKTVNRDKTVELLITVNHETLTETFPSYTKLRTNWQNRPQSDVGTHFIRSITYGGQLIISYQLIATQSEYMEDIKAAVNANLALSGSLSAEGKGNFEKLSKAIGNKARIMITAFGTTGVISPPQNLDDVFNLVDEYPGMVKKFNHGKGTPLKLEIVELSTLQSNYTGFGKNIALDSILNEATNKFDDVRVARKLYREWEDKGGIWPPEKEKLITKFNTQLELANKALTKAISELDITGGMNQFDEAFNVYGADGDNIPNRYSRELQQLIHTVENKPFYWFPYTKAVTHYIHWGSKNCSLPSSDPIFIGYAGTSNRGFGNGGNMLCLRNTDPGLSKNNLSSSTVVSLVNGIGYEAPDQSKGQVFCAMCKLENATAAYTIAGRTECPAEMKLEYSGYLMTSPDAGSGSHFVCVDKNPDQSIPSEFTKLGDQAGTLQPIWMKCDKCDPDDQNRFIGCVVCSR